jgi:hypothetical protein
MSFPMPPSTMPPPMAGKRRWQDLSLEEQQVLMGQGMTPDAYDTQPGGYGNVMAMGGMGGGMPAGPHMMPDGGMMGGGMGAAPPQSPAFDYPPGGYGGMMGMPGTAPPPAEAAPVEDQFSSPIYEPYFNATAPEEDVDPFNPMGDAMPDPFETAQPAKSLVSAGGSRIDEGSPRSASSASVGGTDRSGGKGKPTYGGRIGRRMASRSSNRRRG